MTVREELHQLADTLQGPAADALLDYARWLAAHEGETLMELERLPGHEPAAAQGIDDSLGELLRELLGDGPEAESPPRA